MPARLRPADPAAVAQALERFRAGEPAGSDLRLLVKHFLALLALAHPGGAVEIRVPPYAVAQAVAGVRHTRGTPPAVVELDAVTWVLLAVGDLAWADAAAAGRVLASGERSDLSGLLPVTGGLADT